MILSPNFFNKKNCSEIAKNLIGCYLVRKIDNKIHKHVITEVEAYCGKEDQASHARFGKTKRNEAMFGPAGTFYIYLIYGVHWMLNVVTGPKNYPSAILIRGVDKIKGPGLLTKKLSIDMKFNKKKALPENLLWFEQRKTIDIPIIATPRIGIGYAGTIWKNKKYRFILASK